MQRDLVEVREAAVFDVAEEVRALSEMADRAEAKRRMRQMTEDAINVTGTGLRLAESDLRGLDLSGFDLRRANLVRAELHGTNFSGADLSESTLICAGMERTSFRDATMVGAYIHAAAFQVCDLRGADLSRLVDGTGGLFHGCALDSVVMDGAVLGGVSFYQCTLDGVQARNTHLQGAVFNECAFKGADFRGCQVDNVSIVKGSIDRLSLEGAMGEGFSFQRVAGISGLVLKSASLPGLRLRKCSGTRIQAEGLSAPDVDIIDCDFQDADFRCAALPRARVSRSNLNRSVFDESQLDGAAMRHSSFLKASLRAVRAENFSAAESDFSEACFASYAGRFTTMRDCDLRNTDFSGAYLYRCVITGDHPAASCLVGICFANAVLVQAYIVGDMENADLRGAKCAYARFNQSSLRDADLRGAGVFEASFVKTDFTGAELGDMAPPIFADRCPGLDAAAKSSSRLQAYLDRLRSVLADVDLRST